MNLSAQANFLRISGLVVLVGAISAISAQAAPLYWVGDGAAPGNSGTGIWNLADGEWSTSPAIDTNTLWTNGEDAFFTGSTGGLVTILDGISASTITFSGTPGVFTIDNGDSLTVTGTGGITNSAASAQILLNHGLLQIAGSASITPNAGISLSNGLSFDIAATTSPTVTLTSLTNSLDGSPGQVAVGRNNLELTNFTMSTVAGDDLAFVIGNVTPALSTARITVSGGVFSDPNSATKTTINFTSGGPVQAGTYDLINFAGATSVTGFNLSDANIDFQLGALPENVAVATLKYDNTGTILQLVAVPEPSTLMMPMAAVLGMAWLRRRTARMAR